MDFKKYNFKFLLLAGIKRYLFKIGMNLIPLSSLRIILLRVCGIHIGVVITLDLI